MVCGIYAIVSPSNKAYIGSSKDIVKRWYLHRFHLKRGDHHCVGLQRAFNRYSDLKFVVIEECTVDDLLIREQFWMDNCLNIFIGRYNSSGIAGRVEPNEQTRMKQSLNNRGQKRSMLTCQRISDAMRGKPMGKRVYSEATKQIFREGIAHARSVRNAQPGALESRRKIMGDMRAILADKRKNDPLVRANMIANLAKAREKLAEKRHMEMLNWIVQ